MSKHLALFDFDGTLTKKDTFLEFIKYLHGQSGFLWGFLIHAPFLIAMKLKLYPNWKVKEKIICHFFKGIEKEELEKQAKRFCEEQLPKLMRKTGVQQLENHIKNGDKTYIVSASASLWIAPWCEKYALALISTELEIKNTYFTGKIAGKNCYGREKVDRITALEDLKKYKHIFAYGDSRGDKQMLEIADKPHYKYFKD
ncbi:MAG: phosphatidylglycerophosphatase C [Parvicella sp.]|jgi:phosphatidylglycerophosphatase C